MKKNLLMTIFFLVLMSLFIFTGCCLLSEAGRSGGSRGDFTLKDLGGNEISLSDHTGEIVVLNFWATWCSPCREEIPDFIEVFDEYSGMINKVVRFALQEGITERDFLQTIPPSLPDNANKVLRDKLLELGLDFGREGFVKKIEVDFESIISKSKCFQRRSQTKKGKLLSPFLTLFKTIRESIKKTLFSLLP